MPGEVSSSAGWQSAKHSWGSSTGRWSGVELQACGSSRLTLFTALSETFRIKITKDHCFYWMRVFSQTSGEAKWASLVAAAGTACLCECPQSVAMQQGNCVAEPVLCWNSPMKDPALQMRLKTQLSGGSVPHLLQSQRWRTSLKPTGDLQWPPFGFPAGPDFLLRVRHSIRTLFWQKTKTMTCLTATLGIKWKPKLQLEKPFTDSHVEKWGGELECAQI